jgi:hypothetical protein
MSHFMSFGETPYSLSRMPRAHTTAVSMYSGIPTRSLVIPSLHRHTRAERCTSEVEPPVRLLVDRRRFSFSGIPIRVAAGMGKEED